MNIVVLDIGGSSLKIWKSPETQPTKFKTGDRFTPDDLLRTSRECIGEAIPDRISIGYPGRVRWGRPAEEPMNLGTGWVGFDFSHAFERPVRIMNDAEMQALGGYEGGRMLYLGLGTGLGTTLITEGGISQIALGLLPFKNGKPFEAFLTKEALGELGIDEWRQAVAEAASLLKRAILADYVLLGGGGVEQLDEVPDGCRRGGNVHAYFGGLRMWEDIGLRSAVLGYAP
jgi:polyphosphate glucokinase